MKERGIGFQVDALLAPEQALTLYFARAALRLPQTEAVSIERALGRILAVRAVADAAYPPAPRSAMDGFALRAEDTPGQLRLCGEIRMGGVWRGELEPRSAVRIPTGGTLPPGADAVVPIEDARVENDSVVVSAAVPRGDAVTPAGSDMLPGEVVLEPGRSIGPAELGVLATLGMVPVPVYRQPVIAVISSGDELVEVTATALSPGQIRDSNRWAVAGGLETMGALVRHLPTASDDPGRLEGLLRQGLCECDGVVLTGGSSVGERDFTPQIVEKLGAPGVIVHGLRVKPGKPTVLASVGGKPVIGLPGNPASALMILQAVAAPIIDAIAGVRRNRARVDAVLGTEYRKRTGWTWFVPVRLDEAGATPRAYPLELRSSSTSLLARASGFLELDETVEYLAADTPVRVMRFVGS